MGATKEQRLWVSGGGSVRLKHRDVVDERPRSREPVTAPEPGGTTESGDPRR